MDSRINSQRPTGPMQARRLGSSPDRRMREFLLPKEDEDEDQDADFEEEVDDVGEQGVLSPQPRRGPHAVSRERLADEAGQRLDVRG